MGHPVLLAAVSSAESIRPARSAGNFSRRTRRIRAARWPADCHDRGSS
jgi:hypothetical protein